MFRRHSLRPLSQHLAVQNVQLYTNVVSVMFVLKVLPLAHLGQSPTLTTRVPAMYYVRNVTTANSQRTNPGREHRRRATSRTAQLQWRPVYTVEYTGRRHVLMTSRRPRPRSCRSWPARRWHTLVSLELVRRQQSSQRQLFWVSNTFSVQHANIHVRLINYILHYTVAQKLRPRV